MQALTIFLAGIGACMVMLMIAAFTVELVDEVKRTKRLREWER